MSEEQTSPDTSSDTSVESVDTSVESMDSVDTTPDATAETSPDVLASEPETALPDEMPVHSEFDPEAWDGNITILPTDLQGPIQFLHRRLEGGYTKKFQTLADERKRFDLSRREWDTKYGGWATEKDALNDELTLLRSLLDGMEDPRLSEFQEKNGGLVQDLAQLQNQFEGYKNIVETDIREQAEKYAKDYRERFSDIFKSEDRRMELSGLLDGGWDPESAAKLVGQRADVIAMATKLHKSGTPTEVAVEHALMKAGNPTKRTPRPGAHLTSGAASRNNPESTPQSVNNASDSGEARLFAARAAMNWSRKNRI